MKDDKLVFQKAVGWADKEWNVSNTLQTKFRIGSITKQFTAVAILKLMEQGKLNLQDSITKFIPEYPMHGHKITIEHLLTHTSGIQSYTGMKDFEKKMTLDLKPMELIDYFKNQPMEFAPGTKWNYNNSGYFLLGYIIEKVSGKTYPQYLEENFFKPLAMTNSLFGSDSKIIKNRAGAYDKDSTGFINAPYLNINQPFSAGSIQSTVEDLFKWHQAVHAYKLVKKESLDKAFTKYKLSDGKETKYGYGWGFGDMQGSPTIGHDGGINGFLTQSIYLPKEDVFVAVFSNCMCNPPFEIGSKMATLAINKTIPTYTEIKIEAAVLESFIGEYELNPKFILTVTKEQNRLFNQATGQEKFEVFAESPTKFFLKVVDAQIEFVKDESGKVSKLILSQNGRKTEAKKIK